MKILSIFLILGLSGQALGASCVQPVYSLTAGQISPCAGFLFSPTEEQRLRLIDQDYPLLKDEVSLQSKQLDLYKQEIDDYQDAISKQKMDTITWQQQAETITQKYTTQQERQGWRDYLFLGLGVLLTVSAAWATGQSQGHK